jgi:hypothetical protein
MTMCKPKFSSLMVLLAVALFSSVALAESTLSERQYRVIESLQTVLADGNFRQVIKASDSAAREWSEGLGLVLVLQLRGQAYQQLDDEPEAIKTLARAYSLKQFDGSRQIQLAMQLGQLYLSTQQWLNARQILTDALDQATPENSEAQTPPALAYVMLALAWQLDDSQSARWLQSIPLLNTAIAIADEPMEFWLTSLASGQYQIQDYAAAEATLKQLIARSPESKNYWLQLASMQQLQSKERDQLATLELAKQRGLIDNENEVLLLAQLQVMLGVPERAARTLQAALQSEQLTNNLDNQRRIAIALQQGRDYKNAAAQLLQTAKDTGDVSLAVTALQLELVDGHCEGAITVADWLIQFADAENRAKALMTAGQCAVELKQKDKARVYFQRAQQLPETTNSAKQWLDYLQALADIE